MIAWVSLIAIYSWLGKKTILVVLIALVKNIPKMADNPANNPL